MTPPFQSGCQRERGARLRATLYSHDPRTHDPELRAALVAAVIGFLIGWLWYSPLLFAKPCLGEMKFTEAEMKAAQSKGMEKIMLTAFVSTLVCVAIVGESIKAHGSPKPGLRAPN